MRRDRITRIHAPSSALAVLAALLVVLGLAVAGPAHAEAKASETPEAKVAASPAAKATASPTGDPAIVLQRGAQVQFGEDVYVPAGTTTPSVVAFGGDVTVDGTVTDAVVVFGGDVTIRGTVGTSTVAFGGDVTVGPDAVLGSDLKPSDASLVLFGGTLTQAPGAEVVGQTETIEGVDWNGAFGWAARSIFVGPGFSLIGWLLQTAFCLVLALVVAALMPRQLRTIQHNVGHKPWASLGWGALVFFIAAPAALVVLVISVIGLLLVLPYLLVLLLAYFVAATGAAAFLAQKVLTGFGGKENLMLAVTIGVIGTTVLSQIPVAGPLLLLILIVFGIGAAAIGAADWRRRRREEAAVQAAQAAAAQYATGGVAAHPSVITPMVYTAPDMPAGAGSATTATVAQPAMPAGPPAAPAGPPPPPQPPAEMLAAAASTAAPEGTTIDGGVPSGSGEGAGASAEAAPETAPAPPAAEADGAAANGTAAPGGGEQPGAAQT